MPFLSRLKKLRDKYKDDQGTGKTTVAKLFSLCSWLEKTFFRGDYDVASFGTLDFYEICRGVRI